jgi:hypothetical protein
MYLASVEDDSEWNLHRPFCAKVHSVQCYFARRCRVGEKTIDVRDTAELHPYTPIKMLDSDCVRILYSTGMDPRRARDPRLARPDPRQQQPQQRLQLHTPTPNNGINSNPGSHSITPPQPFVTAMATVSSQVPPAADASTSASTHSMNLPSAPGFKIRPLFCVVCASNQVSCSGIRVHMATEEVWYRTDPWKVTLSCSAPPLLYSSRQFA